MELHVSTRRTTPAGARPRKNGAKVRRKTAAGLSTHSEQDELGAIAVIRCMAAEIFRGIGEMAAQLEAEDERNRQFLFIAALRSMAVHGEQLMQQIDDKLRTRHAFQRSTKGPS